MEVKPNHFETEAEAIADARALGLHTITVNVAADSNEPHCRDFDAMIYMLSGELRVTETVSGDQHICQPGGRLHANGFTARSDVTDGYRAVIGFSKPLEQLPDPLNMPLPIDA